MALVRVRLDDGREFTTGAALAESKGWEVLDEPPLFGDGTRRPPTRSKRPERPQTTTVTEAVAKEAAPVSALHFHAEKETH